MQDHKNQGGCRNTPQQDPSAAADEMGVSPGIASAVAKLRALKAARAAAVAAAATAAAATHNAPRCDSSSSGGGGGGGIGVASSEHRVGSGTSYMCDRAEGVKFQGIPHNRGELAAAASILTRHSDEFLEAMDGWHSHRSHSSIHSAPCSGHSTARRHRGLHNADDPCRPSPWAEQDDDWA
jgi:hypothetical protein